MENNNYNLIINEDLIKNGLSTDQVNEKISEGATNKVVRKSAKPYYKIFLDNFCTFFNLLCFICFVVLLVFAKDTAISNFFFVFLFVTNSIIGTIQEIRAKRTVERLTIVKAPTARTLRNGKLIDVPISDLVLNDVIELSQGSQIPADCIILNGKVEVNEALITGESVPVRKTTDDELLSGSFIVAGKCLAVLCKVGKDSYVQQLTEKAKVFQKTNSPLLNSLNKIIKTISIMIVPIALGSGIVNYYVSNSSGQLNIPEVVISTCSVVIGMIPCGMFFLTTVALAAGVLKLEKYNTLVHDMYSLEMLARVNVLCLDKTGTITDGHLTVREILPLNDYSLSYIESLIVTMEKAVGDENNTAKAITEYLNTIEAFDGEPIYTQPFNSAKKYAFATFNDQTLILGAPRFIMKNLPKEIEEKVKSFMKFGCRVVMFAKSKEIVTEDKIPDDITPLALVVLEDNIRPEAIETIKWFQSNDVMVRVISGDDPLTVSEIARRAGIIHYERYIDLQNATDEQVKKYARYYTVFGRVSPEQKALIIKTMKDETHTIAMTGDGVNDILAMKEADCSITVASGSNAARSLAHLVLVDDNFNSLPKVVAEGRRVVNNIQRSASLYLMKTFFTFAFALLSIASVSHYPFTPGMMLMLEFLIIGVPSLILSLQPNSERIKGKFINKVLSHAIPGAVVLVFNALAIKLFSNVHFIEMTEAEYDTLSTIVLAIGGWSFLTVLCYPYDKFRAVLVAFVTVLVFTISSLLLTTDLLSNFFHLQPIPFSGNIVLYLILIGTILADYLILTLIKWVFKPHY